MYALITSCLRNLYKTQIWIPRPEYVFDNSPILITRDKKKEEDLYLLSSQFWTRRALSLSPISMLTCLRRHTDQGYRRHGVPGPGGLDNDFLDHGGWRNVLNPMTYLPLKLLYFVLLKKEHLRRLHLSSRCCLHHHHHWHRHGCHHHHHHHHHHYQLKLTRWHLTLQSCCLPALQKLWEDKGKQKQANRLKVNNFSACYLFLSINAAA